MCTAMLYDPKDHFEPEETAEDFKQHSKLYERFMRLKQSKLLQFFMRNQKAGVGGKSILRFFFNY